MAHLLNVATYERNRISNAALRQLEKVSETIASVIAPKYATAGLKYSDTAKAKAKAEVQHEKIDIMLGIRSRGTEQNKYDIHGGQTFKKGVLSKGEKLMSKSLRLNDVYNAEVRKQDALERLTALNGGYETKEILAKAEEESLFATFNDNSLPAKLMQGFKDVLNIAGFGKRKSWRGPAEFGFGDLIIKYAKVPGNVIARTLEFSPLGYTKAIYNMWVVQRNTGNDFSVKRDAALAFGRATTGTGLMALGAWLLSA
jgi:hypothetical protein